MLTRYENGITYTQTWTPENKLDSVQWTSGANTLKVRFLYDGDGNRLARISQGPTTSKTVYIGGIYEKELVTGKQTKYYAFNGQIVAMRTKANASAAPVLHYLFSDHLGSSGLVTTASGAISSVARYLPYGSRRAIANSGTLPTDKTFTGQRSEDFGLMDYNARYYSVILGRFVSSDTVVPDPSNPLAWDRYNYAYNNPSRYTDPSGHFSEDQLKKWYGDNWKQVIADSYSKEMIILLTQANFGDLVTYELHGKTYGAVFASDGNGGVGMWDLRTKKGTSIGQIDSNNIVAFYKSENGSDRNYSLDTDFSEGAKPKLVLPENWRVGEDEMLGKTPYMDPHKPSGWGWAGVVIGVGSLFVPGGPEVGTALGFAGIGISIMDILGPTSVDYVCSSHLPHNPLPPGIVDTSNSYWPIQSTPVPPVPLN